MGRQRTLKDLVDEVKFVASELDDFLDHDQPNWGYFDSELGYVHRSIIWRDGVDGSFTRATYHPHGARLGTRHTDRPCRINTYGDSFTEGACVSDGETWQEVLAARLGEPVRNFGIGGQSSYQAYRRMRRTETTDHRAQHLILTIYLDEDSHRNLDRFRWVRWHQAWNPSSPDEKFRMVHANPGCYLRYDPASGECVEEENPCPTIASLYRLTDAEFVTSLLENDLTTQLVLARKGYLVHNLRLLQDCAKSLGLQLDFTRAEDCRAQAEQLHAAVALRSAITVVGLWMDFCQQQGRHGFIATCADQGTLEASLRSPIPQVHPLITYLRGKDIPCFDAIASHTRDYAACRSAPERFACPLYNYGHYSPTGNFHFAQGIARALVQVMPRKPELYDAQQALELSLREGYGRNFALQPALDAAAAS